MRATILAAVLSFAALSLATLDTACLPGPLGASFGC